MPVLLREAGFKVFFYANEHEPKHVHVEKAGDYAKIELTSFRVVNNCLKPRELKKALAIVKQHNAQLERGWNDWFEGKVRPLR